MTTNPWPPCGGDAFEPIYHVYYGRPPVITDPTLGCAGCAKSVDHGGKCDWHLIADTAGTVVECPTVPGWTFYIRLLSPDGHASDWKQVTAGDHWLASSYEVKAVPTPEGATP